MALDRETIKKINDFVYLKPRTIEEIACLLGKNWRTADRYVEAIAKETGSIAVRTFRKGTRGALKIAYWNNLEKIHSSEIQEKLFRRLETGKKTDFSPFDIYQHVDDDKRKAVVFRVRRNHEKDKIRDCLKSAERQVLSFSGNLSWINEKEGKEALIDTIRNLAKRNISIKVLSRVSIDSMKNVSRLLSINDELGKRVIEIRHAEQPLRGFVIDDALVRLREFIDHANYDNHEIEESVLLFYEIYDPEWIEWMKKIFWHIFRTSMPAEKRMRDLSSIMNIYMV